MYHNQAENESCFAFIRLTHYGALTQLHTLAHHLLLTWLCTCALALQHNNGRDADFAVADQGLAIDDLVLL